MNIPVTCPFCGSETDIFVEIDSPSDYQFSSECDVCGKQIKKLNYHDRAENIEDIVYEEVIDYYSGQADYLLNNFNSF